MEGKVAIVTGAGSGIGRAVARLLSDRGARLMLVDWNPDAVEETATALDSARTRSCKTDISDSAQVEKMVADTVLAFGQLDFGINNAGILGPMGAFTADLPEMEFDRVIAVNLRGTWLCMKHEIPHLLKTRGAIVNTASIAGLVGMERLCAYSASKHGIIGLTRSAALEYAGQGIRINTVCPGGVRTPMAGFTGDSKTDAAAEQAAAAFSPMGRVAEPEEIAEAIVWMCSDAASYLNGHAMAVDGGFVAR